MDRKWTHRSVLENGLCVVLLLDAEDEEADGVGVFRAGAVGLG